MKINTKMNFLKKSPLDKIVFHCIFILIAYIILLFIRLPILVNADSFLTSDEGFMASHIMNLFNGGPFSFYYENVSYAGTFNGLIAIPFFWLFGVSSLVFKLPAVLFYTLNNKCMQNKHKSILMEPIELKNLQKPTQYLLAI